MLLATVFPMKRVKGLVNLARAVRIYGDGGQEGRHVLSSQQQKRGNGLAKKKKYGTRLELPKGLAHREIFARSPRPISEDPVGWF